MRRTTEQRVQSAESLIEEGRILATHKEAAMPATLDPTAMPAAQREALINEMLCDWFNAKAAQAAAGSQGRISDIKE